MKVLIQRASSVLILFLSAKLSIADTLPLENGDIHDIYGPIAVPEPFTWVYYLAAVLIFLALVSVLFFLYKKRKPQPAVETPIHETALSELEKARKYIDQNLSLKYAQKVSSILRNYLEVRFAILSTRQTTSEFLDSFEHISDTSKTLLQPYRTSLQTCLEQCDLAKYAHKTTQRKTMEQLEETIRTFIHETTPKESE